MAVRAAARSTGEASGEMIEDAVWHRSREEAWRDASRGRSRGPGGARRGGLCGCVALTGSTLGQNIDDTNITTEIKARLAAEKAATLTRVHVETQQGTVYLTGIVPTEALKTRAGEVAGKIQGVRQVVNNIKVQP